MYINALMIGQVCPKRYIENEDHFQFKRITDQRLKIVNFELTEEIDYYESFHRHYDITDIREIITLERAETIECSELCTMLPHRLDVGGFHDIRRLINDIISN